MSAWRWTGSLCRVSLCRLRHLDAEVLWLKWFWNKNGYSKVIYWKTRVVPLLLLLALSLTACNGVTATKTPIQPSEISVTDPTTPEVIPPGDPVEALLVQMTLQEKIGQMTQVELYSLETGG